MSAMRAEVQDTDLGWNDFVKGMEKLRKSPGVLVGVGAKEGSEIVTIAAANEFGTSIRHGRSGGATIIVPERSFLRGWAILSHDEIVKRLGKAASDIIDGKDERIALGRVGVWAVGGVKKRIASNIPPANAPSTLRKKAPKTHTLINQGILLGSIDFEVVL